MSQRILVFRQFISEFIYLYIRFRVKHTPNVTADVESSTLKSHGCYCTDNITNKNVENRFSLKIQFDQPFIIVCFYIGLSSSSVRLLPQLHTIDRPVHKHNNTFFHK